jgi:hypothetical protein
VSPGHAHVFVIACHAIRANDAGDFLATLVGDTEPRLYTVVAGEIVPGRFASVLFSDPTIDGATTLVGADDLLGLEYSASI